jgi:hypothetical protein
MVVGSKQVKKMICLACKDIIGDHSFNKLGKCLIRVQSELLLNINKNRNNEGTTVGEIGDIPSIDTMDKENSIPNSNLNEDVLGQKIEPITSDGELGFNEIGEINSFDK